MTVPHNWIIASLENIKAHPSIVGFMKRAMPQCRSELRLEGESYGHCKINRGIFQGDSLSPLLFIKRLKPLTHILNNTREGYKLDNGNVLNHLLYMDDLKLYGKNEKEIESPLHIVRIFRTDIGMTFGTEKFARLGIRRGNEVKRDGIRLPYGQEIKNLDDDDHYRYLGVLEKEDINHQKDKNSVQLEYNIRLRLILESKLSGKSKISAMNTYAVPLIRYTVE